jgi:hypothetical protein
MPLGWDRAEVRTQPSGIPAPLRTRTVPVTSANAAKVFERAGIHLRSAPNAAFGGREGGSVVSHRLGS